MVYDAVKGGLESDAKSMDNIRSRTVSLLASATLFISFSAGLGFINVDPNRGPVTPLWVSLLLMGFLVAILVLVIFVLHPVPFLRPDSVSRSYFGIAMSCQRTTYGEA
jgi:hypothetical protein